MITGVLLVERVLPAVFCHGLGPRVFPSMSVEVVVEKKMLIK